MEESARATHDNVSDDEGEERDLRQRVDDHRRVRKVHQCSESIMGYTLSFFASEVSALRYATYQLVPAQNLQVPDNITVLGLL